MEINMLINQNYNFDLTTNLCSRHIFDNNNKENQLVKCNELNTENDEENIDNFLSEITIQIDNEVETLYVGPVEIKPENQSNNKNGGSVNGTSLDISSKSINTTQIVCEKSTELKLNDDENDKKKCNYLNQVNDDEKNNGESLKNSNTKDIVLVSKNTCSDIFLKNVETSTEISDNNSNVPVSDSKNKSSTIIQIQNSSEIIDKNPEETRNISDIELENNKLDDISKNDIVQINTKNETETKESRSKNTSVMVAASTQTDLVEPQVISFKNNIDKPILLDVKKNQEDTDLNCISNIKKEKFEKVNNEETQTQPECVYEECEDNINNAQFNSDTLIPVRMKADDENNEYGNVESELKILKCKNCSVTFKRLCWYKKHLQKCCETVDEKVLPNDCDNKREIENKEILENNITTSINPSTSSLNGDRRRRNFIKRKSNELPDNSESKYLYGEMKLEITNQTLSTFMSQYASTTTNVSENDIVAGVLGSYSCHICGASFTQRSSLTPHILRVHIKEKSKTCTYCDRAFTCTGDLTRHIRIHTGDKPFKCTFPNCKFAFISSGDLYKHSRRHTKDIAPIPRPHVCEFCNMNFERPYDLKRHIMRHKLNDPNFVGFECDVCNKKFSRKDQLRMHQYRHIGLKPHRCHVCGKAFSDPSNCAKHLKQHAIGVIDQTEFICDFCNKTFHNKKSISRHIVTCSVKKN